MRKIIAQRSAVFFVMAMGILPCAQTGLAQFGQRPRPEEANTPRLIGLKPASGETRDRQSNPVTSAEVEGVVLDGNRQPMNGIDVYVQSGEPRPKTFKAKTDARGHYSIGGLTPGNYQSCVVYENNAGLCRELNLKDRERWSNDFVLSGLHGGCPWRGGSLSGRSFDWCRGRPIGFEGGDCSLGSNITGNPGASSRTKHNADVEGTVLNTLNQPAQKVAVYIFGLDAFQHLTACTSAKGQYSFRRLAAGRYVTCIVHKETIGLCQDIVLRESQKEKSDFRLATFKQADEEALLKRLPPGAPVSGGLFARVDGKVYDETGAPARGIEVRLERVDKAGNFTTHTDAEGRFSFTAFSGEYDSGVQYKGKHGLLREFTLRAGRTVISDFDLKQFPPD